MTFYQNPFFWAMIGMFSLVGGGVIVSSRKSGYSVLYGAVVVTVFVLARGVLVLPFCIQPRFEANGWHLFVGGAIFVLGLIFSVPALAIKPLTAPNEQMRLVVTGFYALVRNPIYLGEVLWFLGWSIMFRSVIGLAIAPLWWMALLLHTLVEEDALERALGEKYLAYKRKVRGRIIPGLPI
ncbi:MAG: isoprenylcysteine carboxylmethyltransferase family protein [candidate division WOR-3 bacterium]|nr:MAG: isoprenylcysteine carboxylmethyltransferase family protein [candidate division WOR-3 bacterium]